MSNWTPRRRASLAIHSLFAVIPLIIGSVSSAVLWHSIFQSWALAVGLVVSIELLALVGLVLHLARIESPFVTLKHMLPVVSSLPIGVELYLLAAPRGPWVAGAATAVAVLVLAGLSWGCFQTIERLFLDDDAALQERADAHVRTVQRDIDASLAIVSRMDALTDRWQQARGLLPVPSYPAPTLTRIAADAQFDEAACYGDHAAAGMQDVRTHPTPPEATDASAAMAQMYACDACGATLNRGQWLAAKRWGYCAACKRKSRTLPRAWD